MIEILYRIFIVCGLIIAVCIPAGLTVLFSMSDEETYK